MGESDDGKEADEDRIRGWWHVNRSGFPISSETWECMWQHVIEVHPQGASLAREIRGLLCKRLSTPAPPVVSSQLSVEQSILAVQTYLNELQYNHTGTQFFEIRKSRPLSRLMESAKEIIRESLPIKCLEAVVVALYLTSPLTSVHRTALSFKSKQGDLYFRHVVLAVHSGSSYGALGLSRRQELMYKPLEYKSLYDLVREFIECYKKCNHTVVKVCLSAIVVHDLHSCEQIQWKHLTMRNGDLQDDILKRQLEKFSRVMRTS
ncbi:hypothetical protein EMCRGX_G032116 [Ephydatia muelleri]|eukprot:Em0019g713a